MNLYERPELRKPVWVGAFVGWADAQEGASGCIRHLVKNFKASRFADLDPEDFYDFTTVRPKVYNDPTGERRIKWPSNEFYYWKDPDGQHDLVFFVGTEPSLKWRTYIDTLLSVMEPYDIELVINLGCLMDATPHTREPILSGTTNDPLVKAKIEGLLLRGTDYQGPVGISSIFMEACKSKALRHMSLWGHAPHYVQRAPNYKVVKALTNRLIDFLGLSIETKSLERRAQIFEAEVTKTIAKSVEVSTYVKRLEQQYDVVMEKGQSLPAPQVVADEIEEFFKNNPPGSGEQFSSN